MLGLKLPGLRIGDSRIGVRPFPASLDGLLISRYKADEGLVDAGGGRYSRWNDYGWNGSRGMTFDGVNDYVTVRAGGFPYNNTGATQADRAFEIAGWFQTTSAGAMQFLSDAQNSGNYAGLLCGMNSGKIDFQMVVTPSAYLGVQTSASFNDGLPHSFRVVYNGNRLVSGVTFYVDDVVAAKGTIHSNNLTTASIASGQPLRIGSKGQVALYFNGFIRDIAIKDGSGVTVMEWVGSGTAVTDWKDSPNAAVGVWLASAGENQWVEVADNNAFTFGNGSVDQPFSGSAEFQPANFAASRPIICKGNNVLANAAEYLFYVDTDGKFVFACYETAFGTGRSIRRKSDAALVAGQPYELGFTYDGSMSGNGIKLYVNGVEVAGTVTDTAYAGMANTTSKLYFGAGLVLTPSWDSYHNGHISNVKLYSGAGFVEANLIGHWRGDGNLNANWTDSIAARNGTVAGSPVRSVLGDSGAWRAAVDATSVSGSPLYAVRTQTAWRRANDMIFSANPLYGTDAKGRACILGEGIAWGEVAYPATYARPHVRAFVSRASAFGYNTYVDGNAAGGQSELYVDTSDVYYQAGGSAQIVQPSLDAGWNVWAISALGATTEIYLNGLQVGSFAAGSDSISGISLLAGRSGASPFEGEMAEVIDVVNATNPAQTVADLSIYLMSEYR